MLELIQAIITLGPIIASLIQWYQSMSEPSKQQFLADCRKTFSELDHTTTPEEKRNVAKNIQKLIRNF